MITTIEYTISAEPAEPLDLDDPEQRAIIEGGAREIIEGAKP
jgi:hypothetical protein